MSRHTSGPRWASKGLIVLLAIGLAGCATQTGSALRKPAPSTTATPSPKPAASVPAGGSAAAGSGSKAAKPKPASTPTGGAVPSAPFPSAFDVSAKVAIACLRPGDSQSITITTRPKTPVAYHAQYSDGTNAFDPNYYGGNNGGNTDEAGTWTDSWVVKTGAPPGRVQIDVVAQGTDGRGYTQLFFDIADAKGRCGS